MNRSNNKIKILVPYYPKLIINTLEKYGFDAYIVGGCVRDELLHKKPDDYDITTNAKPEDIKRIFKNTIDTGIKHGTVTVLFYENNKPRTYEVTTFRIDGEYDDGRHPKDVEFVDDLRKDLLRRDFTINAMAYSDEVGLVDEFDGLNDLKNKIVRAVGNPYERFTEDALRLLRAIRFSAKLGFEIESNTKTAISKLAEGLSKVSKERVEVELTKTITSPNPTYVNMIFEFGLAKYVCDGFEDIKVGKFEPKLPTHLAYACLLYNTDADKAYNLLRGLKLDNNNIYKIKSLLLARAIYDKISKASDDLEYKMGIKELINYLNYDLVYDFIRLIYINENDKILVKKIERYIKDCEQNTCPIFIKDLAINGNDIMQAGFDGVEVGTVLLNVQKIVHKNRNYNNKEILMEIIKKVYLKYKGVQYEL